MKAGQILRLTARTIIDFVALDRHNHAEMFDQAPTKEESGCIYLKCAHDMQFGMCGRARHRRAAEEGRLGEYLHGGAIALPDHGCAENLTWALEPYGIPYENIASPVNLFQNMDIDQATGSMKRTQIRPEQPVPIELRAERDLIVALSACPDMASKTGGLEVRATILQP